jgi:hypothetical protein
MIDRQKFFDTGVAGVLNQGRLSQRLPETDFEDKPASCYYRHPEDFSVRCVVGHNMSDDHYFERMENYAPMIYSDNDNMITPGIAGAISKAIGADTEQDVNFARDFQKVHDNAKGITDFKKRAEKFAIGHGLSPAVLYART